MPFKRLPVVVLLLVLASSVAQAYTVILNDGRRVEIPDQFTVTQTTLTYEVSPGFQVTMLLSTINVAATERYNGQPQGSLLRNSSAATGPPLQNSSGTNVSRVRTTQTRSRPKAAHSITNKDLEVYRRARIQSELAYEKRRRELGLPSVAEQRREVAAVEERTQQQLLSMRAREEDSEEYWRSRATSLRTEIATNQAQIEFVQRRLDEMPSPNSFGAFANTDPFGTFGAVAGFPFQSQSTQSFFSSSIGGARFGSVVGFNTGGRRGFPRAFNSGRFGNRYNGRRFSPFARGNVLALPYQSYDYSYERSELALQLNDLQLQQTGLRVRWRELEEEARRAGAYPGWLR